MWIIGVMTKKGMADLKRLMGNDICKISEPAFEKLLNPKQKITEFKSGNHCLACAWVDDNAYTKLMGLALEKKEMTKTQERAVKDWKRRYKADEIFGEATNEKLNIPENSDVIECNGWKNEGEDRLVQKFYYSKDNDDNSNYGIFIVNFKPNSVKVADVHSNT